LCFLEEIESSANIKYEVNEMSLKNFRKKWKTFESNMWANSQYLTIVFFLEKNKIQFFHHEYALSMTKLQFFILFINLDISNSQIALLWTYLLKSSEMTCLFYYFFTIIELMLLQYHQSKWIPNLWGSFNFSVFSNMILILLVILLKLKFFNFFSKNFILWRDEFLSLNPPKYLSVSR